MTLPGTAGTYSIIVVTNANGAVDEGPNAGNDTTVSPTQINVIQEPLPDLIVTSITPPPDGVFSGQSVPVTYTVENVGDAPTSVAGLARFRDPVPRSHHSHSMARMTSFSTTSRFSLSSTIRPTWASARATRTR